MTLRTRPLISAFALLLAACAHSQAAPLPGEAPAAGAGPLILSIPDSCLMPLR